MAIYNEFADVYDFFMERDVPYDAWAEYIDKELRENRTEAPIVLDLACGTGNMTLRLCALGYDMIGVDISEKMLTLAQDKAFAQNKRILWLAQDMCKVDLYGTVDAAVCVCDGLNYVLQPDALKKVFERVRLFLNAGGVFIFDMNTEYKFKEVLANGTFGDSAGPLGYVWDNRYDPETQINEYHMFFYLEKDGPVGKEIHRQRAYDPAMVCNWLMEAGFHAVKLRDGYSDEPLKAESTRVVYICRG